MDRWRGKVAVVTGASSGIGEACAKSLAEHGMKVVACARGVERIHELAKGTKNIFPYKCDVGEIEEVKRMFEWIEKHDQLGRVDVCVANAGVAGNGKSLLEGDPEDWKKILDVNVLGLTLCTQLTIKSLLKNDEKNGHVILVSSIGGHRVAQMPPAHFYCGSKFAVTGLLEGFRQELVPINAGGKRNIRISAISPGIVQTKIHEKTMGADIAAKVMTSVDPMTSEDMADQVVHILSAPPRVQIHDIIMRPTLQPQ